jgi:hypothetical protein
VTVLPGSFLAREARGHNPGARTASAWHWWLKPPNVWKPPSASFNLSNPLKVPSLMTQQLQQIIDAAWDKPRQHFPQSATAEVRDAVEHVIHELDSGNLRVATASMVWASGPPTSGSRRPCC